MVTRFPPGSTLIVIVGLGLIAAGASAIVGAISAQRETKRDFLINRVAAIWLIAALGVSVVLTLQPGPRGIGGARPTVLNLFASLDVEDAVANVLLYIPVGLFATLLWRSRRRVVAWSTGFAFSVSIAIECAQWVLPIDRAATTHDVIFNTLGGFVGAVLGTYIVRVVGTPVDSVPPERDTVVALRPEPAIDHVSDGTQTMIWIRCSDTAPCSSVALAVMNGCDES